MKLIVNKNQLDMAPEQWLRRAGYAYIRDRKMGHESFVRRLGGDFYPRLHMYVEENSERVIFNLHLDQKQASYQGSHMHNAEYDGENVGAEIARLKSLLSSPSENSGLSMKTADGEDIIGHGEFDRNIKSEPKKGWWRRMFS